MTAPCDRRWPRPLRRSSFLTWGVRGHIAGGPPAAVGQAPHRHATSSSSKPCWWRWPRRCTSVAWASQRGGNRSAAGDHRRRRSATGLQAVALRRVGQVAMLMHRRHRRWRRRPRREAASRGAGVADLSDLRLGDRAERRDAGTDPDRSCSPGLELGDKWCVGRPERIARIQLHRGIDVVLTPADSPAKAGHGYDAPNAKVVHRHAGHELGNDDAATIEIRLQRCGVERGDRLRDEHRAHRIRRCARVHHAESASGERAWRCCSCSLRRPPAWCG